MNTINTINYKHYKPYKPGGLKKGFRGGEYCNKDHPLCVNNRNSETISDKRFNLDSMDFELHRVGQVANHVDPFQLCYVNMP